MKFTKTEIKNIYKIVDAISNSNYLKDSKESEFVKEIKRVMPKLEIRIFNKKDSNNITNTRIRLRNCKAYTGAENVAKFVNKVRKKLGFNDYDSNVDITNGEVSVDLYSED